MQLSAVFSEADSILEDAGGSCEGSVSSCPSHREQADDNSPNSGQSSAHRDAAPASFSGKPENIGCNSAPGYTLPAGDPAEQAYSSDASHSKRANRDSPKSGQCSADADAAATFNSCQPKSAICSDMQSSVIAVGEQAASAMQRDAGHKSLAPGEEQNSRGQGGMSLPAQAASSATAVAATVEGGTDNLHGATDAPAPHDSQPGPCSSGAAMLHDNSQDHPQTAACSHGELDRIAEIVHQFNSQMVSMVYLPN